MARKELRVSQDILQKQDVGLHASNVELIQGSLHFLYCMQIGVASAYDLQTQPLSLTTPPHGRHFIMLQYPSGMQLPGGAVSHEPFLKRYQARLH